jgi:hypothetical protein
MSARSDRICLVAVIVLSGGIQCIAKPSENDPVDFEWRAYLQHLRSKGELLSFVELARSIGELPDERNGARLVDEIAADVAQAANEKESVGVLFLGSGLRAMRFGARVGVPGHAVGPTRNHLSRHKVLHKKLDALDDFHAARFDINYEALSNDPFAVEFPFVSTVVNAARFLCASAIVAALDHRPVDAASDLARAFRLSSLLDGLPTMVGEMVKISIENSAIQSLEFVLASGELDRASLERLASEIDHRLRNASLRVTGQVKTGHCRAG